jgi:hypothetical protein
MEPKWQALAREAGIAAEHLAVGVTMLGKANYAHHGIYYQAFFDLSIGLERAAKLAYILDFCIDNGGSFPSNKELKGFSHNLESLVKKTDEIAKRRKLGDDQRLPNSVIHKGIIKTLSEFAIGTRYYNLDFLAGDSKAVHSSDPLKAWYERVIDPILKEHYTERHRNRHIEKSRLAEATMGAFTLVRYHTETGESLDSVYKASIHSAKTEFAKPYSRMYVMQIIRFLAVLLSELSHASMKERMEEVPYMSDFFRIFYNEDAYFRSRKTWSIYTV